MDPAYIDFCMDSDEEMRGQEQAECGGTNRNDDELSDLELDDDERW